MRSYVNATLKLLFIIKSEIDCIQITWLNKADSLLHFQIILHSGSEAVFEYTEHTFRNPVLIMVLDCEQLNLASAALI